jgi:hypothetical protein
MTLSQIVILSGVPLFILALANYAVCIYVSTHKLKEMDSYVIDSNFVSSPHDDSYRSIIHRVGSLGTIWGLLVFKQRRKPDPGAAEGIKRFPKHLRPWVVIPGNINAACIIWLAALGIWSKLT